MTHFTFTRQLVSGIALIVSLFLPNYVYAESIKTCTDYKPFHVDEYGKKHFSGQNIETLYQLAEHVKWQVDDPIRATFGRCLKLLESGQIDILVGLVKTPQRDTLFHMLPYSSREQLAVFYVPKDNPVLSLNTLPDDFSIGIHKSFELPNRIKNSVIAARLTQVSSVHNGLEMALRKRIHGVLSTVRTGQAVIQEVPEFMGKFDFVTFDEDQSLIYFGISRSSPFAKHLSQIEDAILWLGSQPEFQHLEIIDKLD